MSNFINDVINADAILDEIDDYIEKWHDSDTDCSVFEYLGMTEEEYFLWVENDFYLKYIISAHEKDINISQLLTNELLKEESYGLLNTDAKSSLKRLKLICGN